MTGSLADPSKTERHRPKHWLDASSKIGAQQAMKELPEEIKAELTACLQHDDQSVDDLAFDIEDEFAEVRQLAIKTGQDLDKKRSAMRNTKLERKVAKYNQGRFG